MNGKRRGERHLTTTSHPHSTSTNRFYGINQLSMPFDGEVCWFEIPSTDRILWNGGISNNLPENLFDVVVFALRLNGKTNQASIDQSNYSLYLLFVAKNFLRHQTNSIFIPTINSWKNFVFHCNFLRQIWYITYFNVLNIMQDCVIKKIFERELKFREVAAYFR